MKNLGRFAVMGALSLSLVICGGCVNNPAGTTASAPALTSVVGTWKLAAIEKDGILMGGDLGQVLSMIGLSGDDSSSSLMELTFAEGGTGTFSMLGESADLTWTETATGADVTITPTDSGSEPETTKATIEGDSIVLDMDGANAVFTADGTYSGLKAYDLSAAKDITSESEVVGNWNLVGIDMMGISMQGDAQTLADQMGFEGVSLSFEAGGKCKAFDEETTYTASAGGATIDSNGTAYPMKMLDGKLVLDMGTSGMSFGMIFEKA